MRTSFALAATAATAFFGAALATPLPSWNLDQPIKLERSPMDPDTGPGAGAAHPLDRRLVFNPTITSPKAGAIWTNGEKKTVTWKTSNIPDELKDTTSTLMLGHKSTDGSSDENLDWTLADGFPLTDGKVSFTVPGNATARDDYFVVLFGDSGNASEDFAIQQPASEHVDPSSPEGDAAETEAAAEE